MNRSTRKEFLQMSAGLLAATAFANLLFEPKKRKPLLCFSTLGCPKWTFAQIVDFADQHGYQGIEVRGIQGQLDLSLCKEFDSPQNRIATLRMMEEKNLRFVDLGSSASMHFSDPAIRKKNLDDSKRFIDLAHDIKCLYIRVLPNLFPKDQDKNATMELIAKGLLELGDYAKGSNVKVLMESHGDFVKAEDIEKVMQLAEHPHVGLVWDIANMWTIAKEPPAQVYKKLKKYICHTHIKDAKIEDGKVEYKLLGQGEIPLFEAIDALAKGGYKGFYGFEWEKLWHPELDEPDIAFANYSDVMKRHFK